MRKITFAKAILEATDQIMEIDKNVYLMGLGVPDPKGIFGTTIGLQKKYSEKRVFDMPILVDTLLQKKDVDAVVTLGAIIKGQTKHDEVIAHSAANKLTELSVKYQKPVSFGISGPGMQERHAYARIRPVAERAVEAVVKISTELKRIQK